jgi:RNA polymerase sigma-70 factor, ECF subfamily
MTTVEGAFPDLDETAPAVVTPGCHKPAGCYVMLDVMASHLAAVDVDVRLEAAYADHRRALMGIAYRMVSSFSDAEDLVQDAFVRLRGALEAGRRPDSDRAYLVTITTRLAIDHLRSARVRREAYVGPWLPEPAVTGRTDLADDVALADSLSTAFLVLLERLGPEQRAVLLLRDVFDFPFAEIAAIIGKSVEATRQIATRARRLIQNGRPRFPVDAQAAQELAARFFRAAREGDLPALVTLLRDDAEFVGDGGDSRRGLTRTVAGSEAVALVVRGIFRQLGEAGGRAEPAAVGGQPAVLMLDPDGQLYAVWSLVIEDGLVLTVHGMVNPGKLAHLGIPLSDVQSRSTHHSQQSPTDTG